MQHSAYTLNSCDPGLKQNQHCKSIKDFKLKHYFKERNISADLNECTVFDPSYYTHILLLISTFYNCEICIILHDTISGLECSSVFIKGKRHKNVCHIYDI